MGGDKASPPRTELVTKQSRRVVLVLGGFLPVAVSNDEW